jgi:hypothetical protein
MGGVAVVSRKRWGLAFLTAGGGAFVVVACSLRQLPAAELDAFGVQVRGQPYAVDAPWADFGRLREAVDDERRFWWVGPAAWRFSRGAPPPFWPDATLHLFRDGAETAVIGIGPDYLVTVRGGETLYKRVGPGRRTALVDMLTEMTLQVPLPALPAGSKLAARLGGDRVLEVVRSMEPAVAYRTRHDPGLGMFPRSADDLAVIGGPQTIDADNRSRLAEALGSDATYRFDIAKGCFPSYGVRLRFERGSDFVDVLLCLECEILATYLNGENVGHGDFDHGARELVSITLALFPGDPAIRELASPGPRGGE